MDTQDPHNYRVGEFEVDGGCGCLRHGDRELHLRHKSFLVLLYLLDNRERLISHDELMDRIWPDSVVTPDTLVQCIVEIRKALGDDPRTPRFVKTIPKTGYRFIGPVEPLAPSPTAPAEPPAPTEIDAAEDGAPESAAPPATRGRAWIGISVLAVLAVVAVVVGVKWMGGAGPSSVFSPPSEGRTAVAVIFFENRSESRELDWMREGLADMMITDLSRWDGLALLSRRQLADMLERRGLTAAPPAGLDEALEIAVAGRAEIAVLGSFVRIGDRIRIDAQLHDAKTGKLLAAEGGVAERPEDVFDLVEALSGRLARRLGVADESEPGAPPIATSMTRNLEAFRYYSVAVEKARAYHTAEAIDLLQRAVELDPEFAMAHARIGYTYAVRWGDTQRGLPYLERANRFRPRLTEKDRMYLDGWTRIAERDYPAAIRTFDELVERFPFELEAQQRLAALLKGEERFDEAIRVVRNGLAIDRDAADLHNSLGGLHSLLGRHDEAIAALVRYVELDPDEPNAYDSLGMAYHWAGRYEEAMEQYLRALDLDPEFELALIHMANLLFQQGQYGHAIGLYERYAEIAPSAIEKGRGHGSISRVHLARGEVDLAEAQAREAGTHVGHVAGLMIQIALARDDAEAVARLEGELLEPGPFADRGIRGDYRGRFWLLGRIALARGSQDEAIDRFRQALRHRPPIYHIDAMEDCLANGLLELGRYDEAIEEYLRILELNPRYPLAHFSLARAHEGEGHVEAREAYERFLEVWSQADPDLPQVIEARRALERLGGDQL